MALTLESEPSHPSSAGTVYEPAGRLDYLLITPPRHDLVHMEALHLHEIAKHPLVLGEPKAYSRRRVQEVFHRYDLAKELKIAVETSSDEYTISCVRSGMGIGITLGIPRGRLYHGLKTRSLRRWFGMAGVGFLWQARHPRSTDPAGVRQRDPIIHLSVNLPPASRLCCLCAIPVSVGGRRD